MPPRLLVRLIFLLIGLSLTSVGPTVTNATQKPRSRQARKPTENRPLTNANIVSMVENHFSDDSIITTIQSNKTQFDVSVDALIKLKAAGVSERIISVMQAAQSIARVSPVLRTPPPEVKGPAPPIVPMPPPRLEQPYVLVVLGETKRPLPLEPTHVGKAKAQGNDLGSLAKEQAIDGLYNRVELATATRIGMAVDSRLAAIPLLGAAVGIGGKMMDVFGKVGRLGRKPKPVTYLWAVPGRSSSLGLSSGAPQFEIVYGEFVGIDPDEYEPFVVRLVQTRENWRLVGATKADPEAFKSSKWDAYSSFIEERVPARSNKIARGHFLIAFERAFESGEYGVVLRPVSRSKIFSGDDIANRKNSGIFFDTVWSFSVAPVGLARGQ